jgi:hypothetical protein
MVVEKAARLVLPDPAAAKLGGAGRSTRMTCSMHLNTLSPRPLILSLRPLILAILAPWQF